MIDIKQLFIQFLKDNNAYEKYVFNFKIHQKFISLDGYFNHFTINGSIDLIAKAFSWDKTKEEYWFWRKMNEKWKITLFKTLFSHLIAILKKHNLYGYFIINVYKEGKKLKDFIEIGLPYTYLYKSFKNTEILHTTEYLKMQKEWTTIILMKI